MKLFYSQLDEPSLEKIKQDIEQYHPDTVVLFCESEWDSRELNPDWAQVLNDNNVHLIVTICSHPNEYYSAKTKYFNSIELVHWPTYWANWTLMCSNMLDFNREYTDFKYPFICLNNKNHLHRCMLVDELTGQGLLDKGVITWHKFSNMGQSPYKFNYYDDSIRLISDDFITKLDSFLIPEEYHESFFHVVGEATTTVTCISEKTYLPIFYKKPFAIMSNVGFHKKLVDLGFELYTELIDYSFDSEIDMNKRASMLAYEVKKLSDRGNYNQQYELIKDKAQRNQDNLYRIINSADYIPLLIKDRAKQAKELRDILGPGALTYTDPRYIHICENAGLL